MTCWFMQVYDKRCRSTLLLKLTPLLLNVFENENTAGHCYSHRPERRVHHVQLIEIVLGYNCQKLF